MTSYMPRAPWRTPSATPRSQIGDVDELEVRRPHLSHSAKHRLILSLFWSRAWPEARVWTWQGIATIFIPGNARSPDLTWTPELHTRISMLILSWVIQLLGMEHPTKTDKRPHNKTSNISIWARNYRFIAQQQPRKAQRYCYSTEAKVKYDYTNIFAHTPCMIRDHLWLLPALTFFVHQRTS